MRRYELMLLFRPDLEDDKLQSAVEKVTRAIVNAGGALTKVSPWGKRRMAYEIQHFREASYFLLHFDIAPSAIREIERGLLLSEEILRHLVTVLENRGETQGDDEVEGGEMVPAAPDRNERLEPAVARFNADEIAVEADAGAARAEETGAEETGAEETDTGAAAEAPAPVTTAGRTRRVAVEEES